MEETKRYNIFTAIAMVVGIVIGSGVFFKAQTVLSATNGNLVQGILAWVVGGLVMVVSAYAFALISANSKKHGGLTDYTEEICGKRAGYTIGWYMALVYKPILTGVLAWVCGRFTCVLFGVDNPILSQTTIILAYVYLITAFLLNFLAPKIAGYFQISTASIKIIPLLFMAIVGVIYGLFFNDGMLLENFQGSLIKSTENTGFMAALCATCFAYEGWIIATSISAEVKDPKKTMPKALVFGTMIVLVIYLAYYVGLAGTYPNMDFVTGGDEQVKLAFSKLLGEVGGVMLYVFIVISCIGTLNGLMLGNTRGISLLANKNQGPNPTFFNKENNKNVKVNSAIFGFILSVIWLTIWLFNLNSVYFIDISELVIIFVYVAYIPLYIQLIRKREDLNKFNRYIIPSLAISASLLMLSASIVAHQWACLYFLIIVFVILLIGEIFYKKSVNNDESYN